MDDVILNWRDKGVIMSEDVEISHYVLTRIVMRNHLGKYNTGK